MRRLAKNNTKENPNTSDQFDLEISVQETYLKKENTQRKMINAKQMLLKKFSSNSRFLPLNL